MWKFYIGLIGFCYHNARQPVWEACRFATFLPSLPLHLSHFQTPQILAAAKDMLEIILLIIYKK